ncbi:MAG: hypothetical protein ACLS89_01970 [Collinsella sp.]
MTRRLRCCRRGQRRRDVDPRPRPACLRRAGSFGRDASCYRNLGYGAHAVQAGSIPVVLEGRDLLAAAQTGTGKTPPSCCRP